jgi:hypothetical protein
VVSHRVSGHSGKSCSRSFTRQGTILPGSVNY